ncbi:MAG: outer membrane beta-barrel protein [Bacteroidota bacterium]
MFLNGETRASALALVAGGLLWLPRAALAAEAQAEAPAEVGKATEEAKEAPLQLTLFVDAYAGWQTSGTGTLATLSHHRGFSGQGATLRAENGLGLAFLGIDASYDAGDFGVVGNVRFGQAASIYHTHPDGTDVGFGVDNLTQAYLLWRPVQPLELDLGMFTSPFGAEALESWKNPNYSLSALYVYGQPSWHTGLKARWQLSAPWTLMAVVVNGVNNVSETEQQGGLSQAPTVGGSVTYAPNAAGTLALGGLLALDPAGNDDSGFDGFADLVATLHLGRTTAYLNADLIWTDDGAPNGRDRLFLGGSVAASHGFSDVFAVGARGEYLWDQASFGGGDIWKLAAGTLTLDLRPIKGVGNLIVRWENRWEWSNQRVFGGSSRGTTATGDDDHKATWFGTVLGVVITSRA